MPRVRFESTIPEFERVKTLHALDSTVIFMASLVLGNSISLSTAGFLHTYSCLNSQSLVQDKGDAF
jgi:hypothetical protein